MTTTKVGDLNAAHSVKKVETEENSGRGQGTTSRTTAGINEEMVITHNGKPREGSPIIEVRVLLK